jgi:peptide/nickel transport system substrate-binding protein
MKSHGLRLLMIILCIAVVAAGCAGGNKSVSDAGGGAGTGGTPASSSPSSSSGSGSSGSGGGSAAPAKDTLIVAQEADAGTLDPQKQGKMPDMNILINMFDTLVTRDANNELAPGLAVEWRAVDDLTWEFKLRQGVTFHNGEPFNAEAVKFSIERLNNPDTKSPIVELKTVQEVKVIDEYTVHLITSAPDPILPNKTVLFGGVMVPPKYIQEKGDDHFAMNPVGTGPYKFVSWTKDSEVVMEANENYWGGAPFFKKLVFKIIPNTSNMAASLRTGEIDIAANIRAEVAVQVQGQPDIEVVSAPGIRTYYVVLDTIADTPLKNKLVRQAINHAVDVNTIIATVLEGHAERAATIVPRQNFGYDPSIEPYAFDLDKAKALMAEAGYPNGFTIDFDANSLDADIVQVIAAQLEQIGIKANINLMDNATLIANITAKEASPMYYMGNTGWTMDAMSNFQSYIRSDRRYNRWHNPEADALVDIEETTIDPKVRQEAITKIQQLLKEEAPFLFLYQTNNLYGMRANIDWTPNPIGVLKMYTAKLK